MYMLQKKKKTISTVTPSPFKNNWRMFSCSLKSIWRVHVYVMCVCCGWGIARPPVSVSRRAPPPEDPSVGDCDRRCLSAERLPTTAAQGGTERGRVVRVAGRARVMAQKGGWAPYKAADRNVPKASTRNPWGSKRCSPWGGTGCRTKHNICLMMFGYLFIFYCLLFFARLIVSGFVFFS